MRYTIIVLGYSLWACLTFMAAAPAVLAVDTDTESPSLLDNVGNIENINVDRETPRRLRRLAVQALELGQAEDYNSFLQDFLRYQAENPQRSRSFSSNQEQAVITAADMLHLFSGYILVDHNPRLPDPQMFQWLLLSPERFNAFINNISSRNHWTEVCRILETLHEHDEQGRDRYFKLILAMAFVWDETRPPMHRQMGEGSMRYEEKITDRYDYFKQLYDSGRSLIPYDSLSVNDLIFVVDTPVPLSELHWARNNTRGSPRRWGAKFQDIEYDYNRLHQGLYQWPMGAYSLENIEERGGICVDQAYFAVLTARAWGIPAMMFSGAGRRGNHAWMGHKIGRNRWEMDAGRYEYDDYVIGRTMNPQKNRVISDHELELMVNPDLRGEKINLVWRQYRLARELWNLDQLRLAVIYGERAVNNVSLFEPAWELLKEMAEEAAGREKTMEILDRQAQAFQRFPDKLYEIGSVQARLLQQQNKLAEAEAVLARMMPRIGRRRSDLGFRILRQRVDLLRRMREPENARTAMERYLQDNRDGGSRVVPVLDYYVNQCQRLGEEEAGARFAARYVSRIRTDSPDLKRALADLEIKAFRQAGDERGLERAERKRQRVE